MSYRPHTFLSVPNNTLRVSARELQTRSHSSTRYPDTGTRKRPNKETGRTSPHQQSKSSRATTTVHSGEEDGTRSGVPNAELLLGQLDQIRTCAAGPPSRSLQTRPPHPESKKQVDSTVVHVNVRGCHLERRTQILAAGVPLSKKDEKKKHQARLSSKKKSSLSKKNHCKKKENRKRTSDRPDQDDRYIYIYIKDTKK